MKAFGKTTGQRLIMALLALVTSAAAPMLSSVGTAAVGDMPCPHMANMDTGQRAHTVMHMHSMPAATDMDCCGDDENAKAMSAPMSECPFACKASCLHAVTAILAAADGALSPPAFQPFTESPPGPLTSRAVGFTTPPPRI